MKVNCLAIFMLCVLLLAVSLPAAEMVQAASPKATAAVSSQVAGELIDINHADLATLATLPGVGEKIAERISAYREANGSFKSVDELLNVKGIGPKMFDKIKPLITAS